MTSPQARWIARRRTAKNLAAWQMPKDGAAPRPTDTGAPKCRKIAAAWQRKRRERK